MANFEVTKKVSYAGTWLADVFADELINKVASRALADKGKSVKLTLNKMGLRIKRTKLFHDSIAEYYAMSTIKTVMRNPRLPSCIMFVVTDPKKKYRVIALRCASDGESIYLNNMYQQLKGETKTQGLEMKRVERVVENGNKRPVENGNWTLRNRSNANANRHMQELFKENAEQVKQNGNINGEVTHVPISPRNKFEDTDANAVMTSPYSDGGATKTVSNGEVVTSFSSNNPLALNFSDEDDDDKEDSHSTIINTTTTNNNDESFKTYEDGDNFVIETEILNTVSTTRHRSVSQSGVSSVAMDSASQHDVSFMKEDLNSLTEEVRGLKDVLKQMAIGHRDSMDAQSVVSQSGVNHPLYLQHQQSSRSRPSSVYGMHSQQSMYTGDPRVVRGPARNYEAKVVQRKADPWASHHRLAHHGSVSHATFTLPGKTRLRLTSAPSTPRGTLRIKDDNISIHSGVSHAASQASHSSRRSMSYRVVPTGYITSSTVERPIEQTYGRPVVLMRKRTPAPRPPTNKPAQFHILGGKKLAIHTAEPQYQDVRL